MALNLKGSVLDIGGGRKPYRDMFQVDSYVGLEIDSLSNRLSKQADFFYDGNVLPFDDFQFDGAVCNQVLEHCSSRMAF